MHMPDFGVSPLLFMFAEEKIKIIEASVSSILSLSCNIRLLAQGHESTNTLSNRLLLLLQQPSKYCDYTNTQRQNKNCNVFEFLSNEILKNWEKRFCCCSKL